MLHHLTKFKEINGSKNRDSLLVRLEVGLGWPDIGPGFGLGLKQIWLDLGLITKSIKFLGQARVYLWLDPTQTQPDLPQ